MTLIYHVYPKDQWCDPKEGTQPFVSKADYDELGEDLRHTHATDCVHIAALEARCRDYEDMLRRVEGSSRPHYEPAWQYYEIRELLAKYSAPETVCDAVDCTYPKGHAGIHSNETHYD